MPRNSLEFSAKEKLGTLEVEVDDGCTTDIFYPDQGVNAYKSHEIEREMEKKEK